jgi:predicted PurR-regulated permease PerM
VPRVISFIVLLAIVLLVGVIFYQVMAQFIVPLFLACVLLVVFQPLHRWILQRVPKYPRLAALVTTVLILLAVLLPLTWLGWSAFFELHRYFAPKSSPVAVAVPASATAAPDTRPPAEPTKEVPPSTVAVDPHPPTSTTSVNPKEAEAKKEQATFLRDIYNSAYTARDKIREWTGFEVSNQQIIEYLKTAQEFLTSKAVSGLQSLVGVLVGLAIMVIALYYFLADGPAMIETVLELSPLDHRYEQELLARFGDVSRAVVVATLLSAVVQGTLAGIGYAFALSAGAPIFLLTVATMATALVPFVGAAAMWICVCGYIYLYGEHVVNGEIVKGNPTTAIILAVYCTIVVSGIDNVIKPFILHGQSKLHPLLALLSILGGMQVLGPVGILVGPMLVSFLQALLNMLRKELDSFSGDVVEGARSLAVGESDAISKTDAANADELAKPGAAANVPVPGGNSSPTAAKSQTGRRTKRKR